MIDEVDIMQTIKRLDKLANSRAVIIIVGITTVLAVMLNILLDELMTFIVIPFGIFISFFMYMVISIVNLNSKIFKYVALHHNADFKEFSNKNFVSSISNNRLSLFVRSRSFSVQSEVDELLRKSYINLDRKLTVKVFGQFFLLIVGIIISFFVG